MVRPIRKRIYFVDEESLVSFLCSAVGVGKRGGRFVHFPWRAYKNT